MIIIRRNESIILLIILFTLIGFYSSVVDKEIKQSKAKIIQLNKQLEKLKAERDQNQKVFEEVYKKYQQKCEDVKTLTDKIKKLSQKPKTIEDMAFAEAKKYDLDPYIILAIIQRESSGNPKARNGSHYGLMQISRGKGEELARVFGIANYKTSDLYKPNVNIRFGTYYFNSLVKRFGDVHRALSAYNIGPTKVASRGITTSRYSKKVIEERRKILARDKR